MGNGRIAWWDGAGQTVRALQEAWGLTDVHFSDCLLIVYPPIITCTLLHTQGLTVVHFSAQPSQPKTPVL